MADLTNKTVVITGASQGIGAAAARAFAGLGANVVLVARSEARITALAKEIEASGGKAMALVCDVSQFAAVQQVIDTTCDTYGGVDILINNAGTIDPIAPLATADPADWSKAIDINLKGVFHGMRAALPIMTSGSTIITVSSGAAHSALEGWSAYCTSKAGVAMLTKAAHIEHAHQGIRVFGLSPGLVATEMQVKIRASGVNPVSKSDPATHRPPEVIATALLWLCTDDADEYLGQEISISNEVIRKQIGIEV